MSYFSLFQCDINSYHQLSWFEFKTKALSFYKHIANSDEFKLEFSNSSQVALLRFRAELSLAGALQFSSWNQVDNTENM